MARLWPGVVLVAVLACLPLPWGCEAQGRVLAAEPAIEGRPGPVVVSVPVRLPITGTRDTQVEAAIVRHLDRLHAQQGQRGVLVLTFDSAAEDATGGSEFGRAYGLAKFLTDARLAGVKTVAFLPEGARGLWPARRS